MIPAWLHIMALVPLGLGIAAFVIIAVDVARHRQRMWIMDVVWPVVALFGHELALWAYFTYGRLATRELAARAPEGGEEPPGKRATPFPAMVGKGTAHCGAGCALGDLTAEWLVVLSPGVAAWFGWGTLFADEIFARWIADYLFAFSFGIAFQFFTIRPMRQLSVARGLVAAVKADTLSLTSWQMGMYGFMALAHFWIFARVLGVRLRVESVEFWFMMQIAMLCGFATAYPVNWWLIRRGIKEAM